MSINLLLKYSTVKQICVLVVAGTDLQLKRKYCSLTKWMFIT